MLNYVEAKRIAKALYGPLKRSVRTYRTGIYLIECERQWCYVIDASTIDADYLEALADQRIFEGTAYFPSGKVDILRGGRRFNRADQKRKKMRVIVSDVSAFEGATDFQKPIIKGELIG